MIAPYDLIGGNASPFSRKLRAILRYRRLPHVWRLRQPGMGAAVEAVKPRLVPMLGIPDAVGGYQYRVDSTPLAYLLEQRHPDVRSILPPDPANQFLCHLLEDFADEWCMQMMYHYRWIEDAAGRFAARWIIAESMPGAPEAALPKLHEQIYNRQRSRLEFVCGDPPSGALIEADFKRLLSILTRVASSGYLFGTRPSLADFALYGQLAELCTDPLPQRLVRESAPLVEMWTLLLDDAGGVSGEWRPDDSARAEARRELLELVGHSYLPFMAANAKAVMESREHFEFENRDGRYRRAPFGYQAKCYAEVRERWSELDAGAMSALRTLLSETGCLRHLES